jgi:hypothetical protein
MSLLLLALMKAYARRFHSEVICRVEAFNVFNHTQFNGPSSVDDNIGSSTFGNAISAAAPRTLQVH